MADVEMKEEVKAEVKEETAAENTENTESAPAEAAANGEAEPTAEAAPAAEADEVETEDKNGIEPADGDERKAKLVEQGVKPEVADAVIKLYDNTELAPEDVDERAVEMLKQFPANEAVFLSDQLIKSQLFGVQNKPQYLMSVMRNLRDRIRQLGASYVLGSQLICGPNIEDMQAVLDRTGYKLEVTVGQRKYGGPPPEWEGAATGPGTNGHEIYIGHIPHDTYEDKLIPMFEEVGKIWDLRLMMDPMTGQNRGYAFLTYCEKGCASEAAKKLDGHEIASGKTLKVNVSIANTRLFVGNIPKSKSKEEILEEMKKHAEGVLDVIIYSSPDGGDRNRNRGFCFVDFVDHKTASDAKRKFQTTKGGKNSRPFGHELVIDWAEQQEEPTDEEMSKVKACYVRNLKEAITEEQIKERFEKYGKIEKVKKVKEYAFVHFEEREDCMKAIEAENGVEVEGVCIECSLAKPQNDKKKKSWPRGGPRGGPGFGDRGGRGGGGRGGAWGGRPNMGGAMGYGAFEASYGGGYDMYGGGGGYGGGYDAYGGGGYGGMAGGYGGGYGGGDYGRQPGGYGDYGGGNRGRGGFGGSGGGRGGGGFRGGRGRGGGGGGGFRGGKRPGDWAGGPASKRGGDQDFSADVNMGTY